jgi:hypothetical protein
MSIPCRNVQEEDHRKTTNTERSIVRADHTTNNEMPTQRSLQWKNQVSCITGVGSLSPTARRGAKREPQFEWWESGNPTTRTRFLLHRQQQETDDGNKPEVDKDTTKHCAWQSGNAMLQSGAQRTVRAETLSKSNEKVQ